MEIWDKKIRDNLHGSMYLRTWDEMPYSLKTVIVESISEALRQPPVSGSLQDIQEVIDFLQWAFRKIDKGDTPEETVRMLLLNREKIDNIKFDSNDC